MKTIVSLLTFLSCMIATNVHAEMSFSKIQKMRQCAVALGTAKLPLLMQHSYPIVGENFIVYDGRSQRHCKVIVVTPSTLESVSVERNRDYMLQLQNKSKLVLNAASYDGNDTKPGCEVTEPALVANQKLKPALTKSASESKTIASVAKEIKGFVEDCAQAVNNVKNEPDPRETYGRVDKALEKCRGIDEIAAEIREIDEIVLKYKRANAAGAGRGYINPPGVK